MQLQEVRDNFIAELELEFQKRGQNRILPSDKMIAAWISEAEYEIMNFLTPVKTYIDLTFTKQSAFQTQNLPTNYGFALRAELENSDMPLIGITDINTTGTMPSGKPTALAIYHNGTNWVAAINTWADTSYAVRLWYSVNSFFYSPGSVATAQDWGTFDGVTFTGNIKVPDKYYRLMIDYLLGKFFTDFEERFRGKIQIEKDNFSHTVNDSLPYQFGGVTN